MNHVDRFSIAVAVATVAVAALLTMLVVVAPALVAGWRP